MESSYNFSGGSRRALLGGAAVAVAGLLAALALVFTNATGVTEVAADAQTLQQIESAVGGTTAARNALGQALLLATVVGDPPATAQAVVESHRVLDTLEQRTAAVSGLLDDPSSLDDALDEALAEARFMLASIDADDPAGATTAATRVTAAFDRLLDSLDQERVAVASRIATAADESSTVATASRFMVAFFIPSAAVVVALVAIRRRRRREQLAIALEQERALSRSKDQLIANLSHELRTPLTGIYTAALALEDSGFAEPSLSTELNGMIIEQSADLTRMVEDLLVSAQADAGRLRFELEPIAIADAVATLQAEFGRTSTTDFNLDLESAHVLADAGRVRQILRNLASNAVRYGGSDIRLEGRRDGSTYRLTVSDDGPGVPPELEARLFQRFVHRGDTPLVVGSVGLGLAICRVLAEGMRGQISYRRDGGRTAFDLELPLTAPADAPMPDDPVPSKTPRLASEEEAPVRD